MRCWQRTNWTVSGCVHSTTRFSQPVPNHQAKSLEALAFTLQILAINHSYNLVHCRLSENACALIITKAFLLQRFRQDPEAEDEMGNEQKKPNVSFAETNSCLHMVVSLLGISLKCEEDGPFTWPRTCTCLMAHVIYFVGLLFLNKNCIYLCSLWRYMY